MVAAVTKCLVERKAEDRPDRACDESLTKRELQGSEYTRSVPRVLVICVAGVALLIFLLDAIIVTDAEFVEERTADLVRLSNENGDHVSAGLLDALADDYVDASGLSRAQIERYLERYLEKYKDRRVTTGGIDAVWKEKDQAYSIWLMVRAHFAHTDYVFPLVIYWAERGDDWKIVKMTNHWKG